MMNEIHNITRRQFINATSTAAIFTMGSGLLQSFAKVSGKARTGKTILSFYCDDTGPYTAGAEAFESFLDYCTKHGIAGESSVILGANGVEKIFELKLSKGELKSLQGSAATYKEHLKIMGY